mgnify:CR=1 FL=1
MKITIEDSAKDYIKKKGGDVRVTFESYHACGG